MSTIRTDTLQNAAGTKSVPVATVVDGSAKAWVNFNGTGTVAIRAAFNVSSITDNGVGDYTCNFTAALADGNYAVSTNSGSNSVSAIQYAFAVRQSSITTGATTKSASAVRMIVGLTSLIDSAELNVAVFR